MVWSSRCVTINSTNANFNVFIVNSGYVNNNNLYRSDGNTWSPTNAVRPVDSIKLRLCN